MHPIAVPDFTLIKLSGRLAAELTASGFVGRSHLTGDDLAHLQHHRQVGHFLLLHVAQDLSDYLHKLDHPYFDWQHPDIRASRDHLERLLSHHIRLDRAHFQQLAERAAFNSLRLLANPGTTIESILFGARETVNRRTFERLLAYFVYFDFALLALRDHYRNLPDDTITCSDFRIKLQKAVVLHAEQVGITTLDYRRQCWRALTGEELPEPTHESTRPDANPTTIEPLNRFVEGGTHQAVAQHHPVPPTNSYPNGHHGLRMDDIPMHLQFAFVQRIFGGDRVRFQATLDRLRKIQAYAEALRYLEQEVFTPRLFRLEGQTVSEFLDVVQAHFHAQEKLLR